MRSQGQRAWFPLAVIVLLTLSVVVRADVLSPDPMLSPEVGGLMFIENVGQLDARARFQVRGGPGTLWLAEDALWLTLVEKGEADRDSSELVQPRQAVNVKLSFPGANPRPRLEAFDRLDTVVHYYYGDDPNGWHTGIPVWGGVRYVDLYPGVDLEVTSEGGAWVWRLVGRETVGMALDVRLRIEGAGRLSSPGKCGRDCVELTTSVGQVALPLLAAEGITPAVRPSAAQVAEEVFEVTAPFAADGSVPVAGDPVLQPADVPEEVYFGTYLGGGGHEWGDDIAVGGEGDIVDSGRQRAVYVTGWTASSDFPTAPGVTSLNGDSDCFVTKLRRVATLVRPEYSAYIGGSVEERGTGIALDAADNVYLTGWTTSPDFPTTSGAYDPTYNACDHCEPCGTASDAWVVKLDSSGTLTYSTFLGGSFYAGNQCGNDDGAAIAVDAAGAVYVTGRTRSEDFPTTPGAYDRVFSNPAIGMNQDTFVVKLDPGSNGVADLLYSTFVGGGTPSEGKDIAVDGNGVVYVIGDSEVDPVGDNYFPTTPGAYDTRVNRDSRDPYVFKLVPAGAGTADLKYSTFLGGLGAEDYGDGIAVDEAGLIYVTGSTGSPTFPTTPGAFDRTCGTDGNCNLRKDVFVSQLDPAGNGAADLRYSTYLGGNYYENFSSSGDIALATNGEVVVTGESSSDQGFPLTLDAFDPTPDTNSGQAFVTRMRLAGSGTGDLVYSTFVGGSGGDEGVAVALDQDDRIYVVGNTGSSNFPTTQRAFDMVLGGGQDAFVIRLLGPTVPDLSGSTKRVAPESAFAGQVVTFTVALVNDGAVDTTARFTDTLPTELLLQGSPASSSGDAPAVDGPTITWSGAVNVGHTVVISYTTLLTSTTGTLMSGTMRLAPTAVNYARIDDGFGRIVTRLAYVNAHRIFLPFVLRN
jgi:uncharacterized repeat protein (TIGR01451 family)